MTSETRAAIAAFLAEVKTRRYVDDEMRAHAGQLAAELVAADPVVELQDLALRIAVVGNRRRCDLAASVCRVLGSFYAGREWQERMTSAVQSEAHTFMAWATANEAEVQG